LRDLLEDLKRQFDLMREIMKARINWLIEATFIFVLVGIFFFFGFDKIFFSPPQGIHFIRQTDSLAFASQYYNTGFDFFNPRLFNLESTDGRAACEFPLLYYITALLYLVFGEEFYLLKILNLLVAYAGVFCVFKLSCNLLKDHVYAFLISLFVITSTVFDYYSFNYLPDAAALGFIFIGWYFYFRYESDHRSRALVLSFLFFTLGSLIKVTYLISPLSIVVYYLVSMVFKRQQISSSAKPVFLAATTSMLMVCCWNAYMIHYNASYHSDYFTTGARPIWSLSPAEIAVVWDHIYHYWFNKYFAHSSFHFLLCIIALQVVFLKRSRRELALLTLILFLGCASYMLLFYVQFKDHDYYFMAFIPLVVFILVNGINTLHGIVKSKWLHLATKLVMAVIVIVGANYARMKLEDRYNKRVDDFSKIGFIIQGEANAIKELNIPEDARFIVAPDLTKNGGLLFLNRMGWKIDRLQDISITAINHYRDLGADYLLLATNEKEILEKGYDTGDLIFSGTELSIFKLNNGGKDNE